jgi:hypothetical protein
MSGQTSTSHQSEGPPKSNLTGVVGRCPFQHFEQFGEKPGHPNAGYPQEDVQEAVFEQSPHHQPEVHACISASSASDEEDDHSDRDRNLDQPAQYGDSHPHVDSLQLVA